MNAAIFTLGLLTAATSPAVPVSVASGDWSNIPLAQVRSDLWLSMSAIEKLESALINDCKTVDSTTRRLELLVPFLMHFGTDGSLRQVVVQRLNCPSAESVLGGAVIQLAKSGKYRPTGENLTGWYRGEFDLVSQQR